ncbi:MAG: amidohydrolase family protein [Gammaproteobacteria bacterium]|nr:amidohydrolase family protein [Gammaproteobacteria bacterium]
MNYLIQNSNAIFSGDDSNFTDLRIANGKITELGYSLKAQPNETVVDAKGCVIYPGFVNTHHHLAQSVLKGVPQGLNQGLGDWLASVPYRFWPKMDAQLMYSAAKLGLYELLRSGATTCADHHYLYHSQSSAEVEEAVWQAAEELGMRLVLCRGSATVQGSHRGMKQSGIEPETIDQVIQRMQASMERHHQTSNMAMKKLVVAPTSLIHSSVPEHLTLCAEFARAHNLKLHSHLLEVGFDEIQAQEKYGMSAVDFAESVNWLGEDVWFAHLVKCDERAIQKLAQTKTAIAHCPTSNCRLGSGIAPVIDMQEQGMNITLGVDGSASAESGSMIQELNLAWLLHRTQHGPEATKAEDVIKWGSENGARLLGLEGTGRIAVGMAADIVLYDIDQPRMSGVHSPLLAPILCAEPVSIKHTFINGKPVWGGLSQTQLDEAQLVAEVKSGLADLLKKVDH